MESSNQKKGNIEILKQYTKEPIFQVKEETFRTTKKFYGIER